MRGAQGESVMFTSRGDDDGVVASTVVDFI